MLLNKLTEQMTFALNRVLTRALLPTLTHSLAPAIALSMMHNPKSDHYCHHCSTHSAYCSPCEQSRQTDYMIEYYANYYASYYSEYYTERYVQIGDLFSTVALRPSKPRTIVPPKKQK